MDHQPTAALSTTLDQIPCGTTIRVLSIQSEGVIRRRMFDLGITPGTLIRVEARGPLGDPTAYLVRDTIIALREEQARQISVTLSLEGEPA